MINFDLINLSALAQACDIQPRTLQMAVKKYQEDGTLTPSLHTALQYLQMNTNYQYAHNELLTEQMLGYMEDLTTGLCWTPGKVLSFALIDFWHKDNIARCPNCHSAQLYPPEVPLSDEVIDVTCNKCQTEFKVEI